MNDAKNGQQSVALRQIAADAPDYKYYQSLDEKQREIRVLDLTSASSCILRHVSLDDEPNYHALSYCWGPATSTRPLNIKQANTGDVRVVPIRRTLASFLKHVFGSFGQISVWLDVICINQRSVAEQSAQVAMMGEIYGKARGVYAWMGKWDPEIAFLFGHCNAARSGDPARVLDDRKVAFAMKVLLQQPYWTRLWIIQECVLSKDLVLMCGDQCISWEELVPLISATEKQQLDLPAGSYHDQHALRRLKDVHGLRMKLAEGRDQWLSLLDLALAFSSAQCSDPRDKLYGFRALAQDGSQLLIDYARNPFDLLITFVSSHNMACAQDSRLWTLSNWWGSNSRQEIFSHSRLLAESLELDAATIIASLSDQKNDWLLIPLVQCPLSSTSSPRPVSDSEALCKDCYTDKTPGVTVDRWLRRYNMERVAQYPLHTLEVLNCGRIVALKARGITNDADWRGHVWVCRHSHALHISRAFYAHCICYRTLVKSSPGDSCAILKVVQAPSHGRGASCGCKKQFEAAQAPPWAGSKCAETQWHY